MRRFYLWFYQEKERGQILIPYFLGLLFRKREGELENQEMGQVYFFPNKSIQRMAYSPR